MWYMDWLLEEMKLYLYEKVNMLTNNVIGKAVYKVLCIT